MQMNIDFADKGKQELMAEILEAIEFDVIQIIYTDTRNKVLLEDLSINRAGDSSDAALFDYRSLEKIIRVLGSTGRTIVLTNMLTRIGQDVLKKINLSYAIEVFAPLFNGMSQIAGFIYLAKQSGAMELERNGQYIGSMRLLIHIIERELFQKRIRENLSKTVLMLGEIINAKQPMLIANNYAVSYWAVRIARKMGLSELDAEKLQLAAIMHNLGKIYLDERLLNKMDETPQEHVEKRMRVVYSYEIAMRLSRIYDLGDIPEIILRYKEKMDGSGYPYGLKGEEIPLLSRVLGMAKEITNMLSASQMKKAMPMDEMIHKLKAASGTRYDARVADAAIALLIGQNDDESSYFEGLGSYATLSLTKSVDAGSTMQMWGQVRKVNNIYVFNPLESMPAIDEQAFYACMLYLNVDEHIHQFQAEIHQILADRVLLKKVVPQQETDSFSVLWFMEGAFISSSKVIYKIYINLLGGDYLDFYIPKVENPEDITSGIVKLELSKNDAMYLPGIITFHQQMEDKDFYRIKYTNITEADRQKVFTAMFNKQLEMRGSLRGARFH